MIVRILMDKAWGSWGEGQVGGGGGGRGCHFTFLRTFSGRQNNLHSFFLLIALQDEKKNEAR